MQTENRSVDEEYHEVYTHTKRSQHLTPTSVSESLCTSAKQKAEGITVSHNIESDIDKILVIDNIDNAAQFSSSRRILQEVHNFFPDIKIEFAYALAIGGVAIHTCCKGDRDCLLEQLPEESSFGGGWKHPPKASGSKALFMKGIDTSVHLRSVTEQLNNQCIGILEIRRLVKRYTGKTTQVVKIKCSEPSANFLLKNPLYVNNRVCRIEKERLVRVIRCFHCQSLGHLAKHCTSVRHCVNCAESHGESETCNGKIQCFNCRGSHPASSSHCTTYVNRYEDLTKQHTKCQHLTAVPASSCPEIKH